MQRQSVQPYEIIIADDGSSTDIAKAFDSGIPDKPVIKHIFQPDNGFRLARSRNNAARHASGDYFVFLDQDVLVEPDFVEKILQLAKPSRFMPFRAVYSSSVELQKIFTVMDGVAWSYDQLLQVVDRTKKQGQRKHVFKDLLYNFYYTVGLRTRGAKLIGLGFGLSKENFHKIDGFDESYQSWGYEDDDFGNRLYKASVTAQSTLPFKPLIHLYHNEDASKASMENKDFYYRRKREISSTHYKSTVGLSSRSNLGEVTARQLNGPTA